MNLQNYWHKDFIDKFWQFYGINLDIWVLNAFDCAKFPKGEEISVKWKENEPFFQVRST